MMVLVVSGSVCYLDRQSSQNNSPKTLNVGIKATWFGYFGGPGLPGDCNVVPLCGCLWFLGRDSNRAPKKEPHGILRAVSI